MFLGAAYPRVNVRGWPGFDAVDGTDGDQAPKARKGRQNERANTIWLPSDWLKNANANICTVMAVPDWLDSRLQCHVVSRTWFQPHPAIK